MSRSPRDGAGAKSSDPTLLAAHEVHHLRHIQRASIAPRIDHYCTIDALLPYLRRLIERQRVDQTAPVEDAQGVGLAVLFIELRRSDRTQALAHADAGRAVTALICDRISDILHPDDRFAFNGFDEMLMVLPDVSTTGRALMVASRLVQTLREPLVDEAIHCRVQPAIGCALYPMHGGDEEELIAAADRASRLARTSDEGYRIAAPGERATHGANLARELETALKGNQLEVWLQPQLNLTDGRFDAAEALIRWPRGGGLPQVSPIRAVELAEKNGLMPDLTLFVLNTILRQLAQFAQRGIDLRIAVNISASMLTDENLPRTVQQALELWDVRPDRVTLEVTENTLMQDVERSLGILHGLKEIGTKVSLDDFGTGYSSFAYLRRMPLDELKIDQLFVRHLSVMPDGSVNAQREGDLRIVRSIIDIAHNFDLRTVAEGVEDAQTLELMRSLGCDVIQGYHTGRPMRIPVFEQWLRERQA